MDVLQSTPNGIISYMQKVAASIPNGVQPQLWCEEVVGRLQQQSEDCMATTHQATHAAEQHGVVAAGVLQQQQQQLPAASPFTVPGAWQADAMAAVGGDDGGPDVGMEAEHEDPAHEGPGGAADARGWLDLGGWGIDAEDLEWDSDATCFAAGGFGRVWTAKYMSTEVIIKLATPHSRSGPDSHEVLANEASIYERLGRRPPSPHIAQYFGRGVRKNLRFIVLARYPKSLHQQFEDDAKAASLQKPVGLSAARRFKAALQLVQGVHWLHKQRVVHLDLRPDNVLLDPTYNIKVCDFGLSQALSGPPGTPCPRAVRHCVGHPGWMAPELMGKNDVDEKADMWAWGVIFYQLSTWEDARVYDGVDLKRLIAALGYAIANGTAISNWNLLRAHLPPSWKATAVGSKLCKLLHTCLEPERADRQDAQQVVAALKELEEEIRQQQRQQAAQGQAASAALARPVDDEAAPQRPWTMRWVRQQVVPMQQGQQAVQLLQQDGQLLLLGQVLLQQQQQQPVQPAAMA